MTPPFAPGELVVCVDGWKECLLVGNIYIVDRSGNEEDRKPTGYFSGNGPWVSLVGVPDAGPIHTTGSTCWETSRFRPLHGTDLRRLETKYPEYIVKTRVIESEDAKEKQG